MKLPPCHSRREIKPELSQYFCTHPQVYSKDGLVSAEICKLCHLHQLPAPQNPRPFPSVGVRVRTGPCWYLGEQVGLRECSSCRGRVQVKVFQCSHPHHETTTYQECDRCDDHESRLKVGGVQTWEVGITTAPRQTPTLERTLCSLAEAGWEAPRLFAEPDTHIPNEWRHLPVSSRDHLLGAFSNWYLGLSELVIRNPKADAYLMCQDDVLFSKRLRAYLERTLWPGDVLGVVALYCSDQYAQGKSTGFHVESHGWNTWGALAYVIPNAAARGLVASVRLIDHRRDGPGTNTCLIDCVVGDWCQKEKRPYVIHFPSLTQHIGTTSTLFQTPPQAKPRRASSFVENVDQLKDSSDSVFEV